MIPSAFLITSIIFSFGIHTCSIYLEKSEVRQAREMAFCKFVDVLHTCESIFLKFAGVFKLAKADLKSFPAFAAWESVSGSLQAFSRLGEVVLRSLRRQR